MEDPTAIEKCRSWAELYGMVESRVELRCMVEDPSLALRLHPTAACLFLGRNGQSSNIRIKIVKRGKAKEWPGKDSI